MKPTTGLPSTKEARETDLGNDEVLDVLDSSSHWHQNQPVPFSALALLRWLPITLDVVFAVAVCLIILVIRVRTDYVAATLIGFLFVQILLAAVWTTLAPTTLITRVVTGTIFVLYICLCMYYRADRDGGGASTAVPITAAMLIQWFLYQIPLC